MDTNLSLFATPTELHQETFQVNVPSSVFAQSRKIVVEESKSGSKLLKGVRIFRVGTFTDMFGRETTWEKFHLDQMVFHFKTLKDGGYLPNVPIREDHSMSIKSVIGYFSDIYIDPDDSDFLSSDVEITEPDAFGKWERGTYRSRSIELGGYRTNDGKEMAPVVLGLGFVDLPAVEGLFGRNSGTTNVDNKETVSMTGTNTGGDGGQPTTPPTTPPATPAPTPEPSPQPTATNMHSAPVQPHAFSIAGVATTDYAKVQAHIAEIETSNAALELAMKETTDSNRKAFASSLAENNKILASQIPSVEALVLTMTPEQFDAYRATYEAAPSIGAFGSHGQESGGAPANPASGEGSGPTSLELAEAVVTRLRRSGMTEEQVVKTSAYAAMQSLQAAQAQS